MSDSKEWPDPISMLRESTRELPAQKRFDIGGFKLPLNPSPFNRIQYFSQALLWGALTDVETLKFVLTAFVKYQQGAGSISLDEAFGLKSKPKAGNPARQYLHNNRLQDLLYRMAVMRVGKPKLTLFAIAENVSHSDGTMRVEALLRAYRRNGAGKRWEQAIRGK